MPRPRREPPTSERPHPDRTGIAVIRIALADDHTLIREGLKRIFEAEADFTPVIDAKDGFELLDRLAETECDVVIMDVSMPGPGFFDTLKRLRDRFSDCRILVLSIYPEEQYAIRALRGGAAGYLHKDVDPDTLCEAVRRIASGGQYVTPRLGEILVQGLSQEDGAARHDALSDREFEVLRLLGSGLSTEDVGKKLTISPKTVGTYRSRINDKMGFKNIAELVRYVVENGLQE